MKIKILTLFPEMLEGPLHASILGRAIRAGHLDVELVNIRDYTDNKHKNTDDYPFGGGAGMVMMPQPVVDAIEANSAPGTRRVYLSPRGRTLTQKVVEEYAQCESLLFLCGHYEGVDQRALDLCIDEELSIGDYVLTGGELAALVAVDAVARLIPGVLGSDESSGDESFTTGLLEYPQYTRPADFRGHRVPEVLLGGNHADIVAWRRRQSLSLTRARRPELLNTAPLTDADRAELQNLDRAEEILRALASDGVRAERLDMFAEAAYAKEWFARFVPEENRSKAKKQCFSGRRHVGWLYQAFEMSFAPCEPGEAKWPNRSGAAILYLNREALSFRIENCEALPHLPCCALLTAEDFTWTFARSNRDALYFAQNRNLQLDK